MQGRRAINGQGNQKPRSNRKRPCLRFLRFPKQLKRCRQRHGLVRQKREANDNNYDNSILQVHERLLISIKMNMLKD